MNQRRVRLDFTDFWHPDTALEKQNNPLYRLLSRRFDSERQDADFYYGFGFSDQNYLVRTADFRAPIYGETHAASARYPAYGGELFEKRVDSWMRNHGYLRATYKHGSYDHVTQVPTF